MKWAVQSQRTLRVISGDLQLFFVVQKTARRGYAAMALEASKEGGLDVLEKHSHVVIEPLEKKRTAIHPMHATLGGARHACERYARKWLRSRKKNPRCSCTEIKIR